MCVDGKPVPLPGRIPPMRDTAIVFDVNETLLDLRSLDPLFEKSFGDASMRMQWFALMLQLSFGGIATGNYIDFPTAQSAALQMLAERRAVQLADADARE